MTIEHKELQDILQDNFPEAKIEVVDLAGDNDHYSVTVVSGVFDGKSRIEQHRMVQDAVKDKDIHALAIKTKIG